MEDYTVEKDGQLQWLQDIKFPIIMPDGTVLIGGVAFDVTERKQVTEELQRKSSELEETNKKLRSLYEQLNQTREEERTGIARELHDELGQALTALRMDVSWISTKLDKKQTSLLDKTNTMTQLIDVTIKVVQRISSELRPGMLDDLGLAPAIEWYVGEFQKRSGMSCSFENEGDEVKDEKCKTALFRIVQEALTNVARHSHATRVHLSLRNKEGKVKMEIKDNGKGMMQTQIEGSKTSGISGMRQRIAFLKGTFDIESTAGEGTIIKIMVPCTRGCSD
jgi:two-component system sensor histidine kinase UhpB